MLADCIYVLEKGKIVEEGNHETLLENKGLNPENSGWQLAVGSKVPKFQSSKVEEQPLEE